MIQFLRILFFLIVSNGFVYASISKELPIKELNDTITEGAFKGGQAGSGFSLLDFKRVVSPSKKSERMIFEIGDHNGGTYSGQPGYFHAQLSRKPPEFTIDFSQMVLTKVDQKKLIQLFKKSKLVKKAKFKIDNEDNSTNLTFTLRKPIKARVYTLSPLEKSPKIVVDIISI